jgi:hypothetical protein
MAKAKGPAAKQTPSTSGLPPSSEPMQRADEEVTSPLHEAEPEQKAKSRVPGGFYIVDGQVVDANNQPIPGWKVVDGEAVKG